MTTTPDVDPERLQRRIQSGDYHSWRGKVEATGGCAHPVHLSGRWAIQHTTTGQILKSRAGQVFAPCGNRRESVCPACSDRYAADAFHLLRAGLSGGTKNVPETVAEKPRLFVTLTAPSFGPVHNRRISTHGKVKPCRCGDHHPEADPRIGQPLDAGSYDYTGHVLWQAHAGQLWHRFTIALRRQLCLRAGIRVREFTNHARLSFAKVAEYQRRGIIHFHAVIRLDGPDGAGDHSPRWATTDLLTDAVHTAHGAVSLHSPAINERTWQLVWGDQIDIRPIRAANASQFEDEHGIITDDRLASYVAKYATKGTSTTETTDRPIRSPGHIDLLDVTEHHRRIIHTAWNLGAPVPCPDCHPHGPHQPEECGCGAAGMCTSCGNGGWVTRTTKAHRLHGDKAPKVDPIDALKPRRWAHMLGFRGHFLSKSRYYSVPFRQIRDDRRQYRLEETLAELGIDDPHTVTVINHWHMTHIGHRSPEERELAAAIAERQRHTRKKRYENERTNQP